MYHILIAEDEYIERMVLAKVLQESLGEEYVIHQAENGKQAIDLFRKYPIGVAVLDIEMPAMNGMDAARIIFGENPNCGIIFLTAYDRFDYAKNAIAVRAIEYLVKPCGDAEIVSTVEHAIYHSEYKPSVLPVRTEETGSEEGRHGNGIVEWIEQYIKTHYHQNISMQDAAYALHYSESHFCKIFKQLFGQNFTSYLTAYRMDRAKEMLQSPNVTIKDVGMRVGYADQNYFTKTFRRVTGQSPSEYKANNQI